MRRLSVVGAMVVSLWLAPAAAAIEPDGSFIRVPDGRVLRVIGGAAIHIHSCAPLDGCPGTVAVPNLDGYAKVPRDGSQIRVPDGPQPGLVAVVAGGAPLHIGSCAEIGGCSPIGLDNGGYRAYEAAHPHVAERTYVRVGSRMGLIARSTGSRLLHIRSCAALDGCEGFVNVDGAAFDRYQARDGHNIVRPGTFVSIVDGSRAGEQYRAAGGTLLRVFDCAALGGCRDTVPIDNGGYTTELEVNPTLADGTILRGLPSQQLWQISGGKRSPTSDPSGAVEVNDQTIDLIPVQETPPPPDLDGDDDGVQPPADCNDRDAAIRPGAADVPGNAVDEDCSGADAPFPLSPAAISYALERTSRYVVVLSLTIRRVPAGSTIELRCRGRGCPFRVQRRTSRAGGRVSAAGRLRGKRLRPGATVEIRVLTPGMVGRVTKLTVRRGRQPIRSARCLPPGAVKSVAC